MIYRFLVVVLVIAVSVPALFAQQKQQASTQTQQAAAPVEPVPVLSVPPGYRYDSNGRRDPFVNPIPKPVEEKDPPPVVRPPGLKGVLISEAKLMGVVTSREASMTKVIIVAPGNKTYFAARGDSLFDAVVKEIKPDAVVFAMVGPVRPGQPSNREIVRRVHPATGENK